MALYKGKQIFQDHPFNYNRYEVISKYPGSKYKIGEVIQIGIPEIAVGEDDFMESPSIFKKLKWYEKRTFDELFQLRFIQMNASQYYIPGDILEIDGFKIDTKSYFLPIFKGFRCGSQIIKPSDCIPLQEHEKYSRNREIKVVNP